MWETWLALFGGWTVTRFVAWPREGLSYSTWGALGLFVLGLAAAAVAGWLIWRYRLRSRRTAMLVHATGVLVLLDLVAWKITAASALPVIDDPAKVFWYLLGLGWLAAGGAAHLADLRSG